jgi:hypothetical protein
LHRERRQSLATDQGILEQETWREIGARPGAEVDAEIPFRRRTRVAARREEEKRASEGA